MVRAPFKFLSDEEFAKLDSGARLLYLMRARREITARQRILREQLRRGAAAADKDGAAPNPPPPEGDTPK